MRGGETSSRASSAGLSARKLMDGAPTQPERRVSGLFQVAVGGRFGQLRSSCRRRSCHRGGRVSAALLGCGRSGLRRSVPKGGWRGWGGRWWRRENETCSAVFGAADLQWRGRAVGRIVIRADLSGEAALPITAALTPIAIRASSPKPPHRRCLRFAVCRDVPALNCPPPPPPPPAAQGPPRPALCAPSTSTAQARARAPPHHQPAPARGTPARPSSQLAGCEAH